MPKKTIFYVIDTSAVLSGKPIHLESGQLVTTPAASQEFKPGGRDYRTFQLLVAKGLTILSPSQEALAAIHASAQQTGDLDRLSPADVELIALALDIHIKEGNNTTIISDDYSIQNVAQTLHINYQPLSQRGIVQTYKWQYQCRGCKKIFTHSTPICPICGTETKLIKAKKT